MDKQKIEYLPAIQIHLLDVGMELQIGKESLGEHGKIKLLEYAVFGSGMLLVKSTMDDGFPAEMIYSGRFLISPVTKAYEVWLNRNKKGH